MSNVRNVGAAAAPEPGPARTVFAVWVANDAVNVPDVVTGLPLTVNIAGMAKATLVTVPPPTVAMVMLPAPLVTLMPEPAVMVVATTDAPVEPTYNCPFVSCGRSASTWVRNVGATAAPVTGPASIVLANWVFSDAVMVPVVVTGDPLTPKILEGMPSATLVTPVLDTTTPLVVGVTVIPVPPEVTPKSYVMESGAIPLIVAISKGKHVLSKGDVHVFPEMS